MAIKVAHRGATSAQNLAKVWFRHRQEIEERPLPYIDELIDELLVSDHLTTRELAEELRIMVPGLGLDGALGLVGIKFPGFKQDDLLPQTSRH